jgi:hypothetical protein
LLQRVINYFKKTIFFFYINTNNIFTFKMYVYLRNQWKLSSCLVDFKQDIRIQPVFEYQIQKFAPPEFGAFPRRLWFNWSNQRRIKISPVVLLLQCYQLSSQETKFSASIWFSSRILASNSKYSPWFNSFHKILT